MSIFFLTTHLNAGGITSYLLTLTKGLCRQGEKVFVGSSGGNMENEFRLAGAAMIMLNIRTKSELDIRIYTSLPYLMKIIKENKIDVIHAHTRITQVMATWLSLMTRVPYVATCHGFFRTHLFRRLFPCWGKKVIAISGPVRDHLREGFNVPYEKIVLIHSGVDADVYASIDPAMRDKWRKQNQLGEGPILGMIARFSDVKGQDIAIEAMKIIIRQVPNVKLFLAGEGKMEQKLRAMVKLSHLENSVVFSSVINQTAEVLSALDIVLVPSRQEGLGLSVMEAQAAGVPVVASRVGGIPSLIENDRTGILVEPENPAALAEAIIVLCQDEKKCAALGQTAKEFIRKNYSAKSMVEKTLEFYRSVI